MTNDATKTAVKRGVDCIGVTCVFLCHDGNKRVLLHQRSANCRDEHGKWDCGGGALEFGEEFEDCVRREVFEEYGAEARNIQHLATHNILRELPDGPTHWIALTFAVLVDPEQVSIGEPHKMDDIGWFTLDALPSPLHSKIQKDFDCVKAAGIL